jgi:hypothetical protein
MSQRRTSLRGFLKKEVKKSILKPPSDKHSKRLNTLQKAAVAHKDLDAVGNPLRCSRPAAGSAAASTDDWDGDSLFGDADADSLFGEPLDVPSAKEQELQAQLQQLLAGGTSKSTTHCATPPAAESATLFL